LSDEDARTLALLEQMPRGPSHCKPSDAGARFFG
jgi:hypothetical protein